ncbi:MAG TPA: S24 family peptidase [Acidobacteriaceae bacterium]|jgi:transcriptional regulator with XRE-family HTH domain|nr:S24 family peptidase [Acidobacteriaceae bacterium]
MAVPQQQSPEWPEHIKKLLRDLKMTQSGLASRLGVSPATVSRWVQGKHEPTAQTYVALGNLARPAEGVYFWERAGLDVAGLPESGLRRILGSLRARLQDIKVVAGAKLSKPLTGNAVAIPLLNVAAYGDRIAPRQNVVLSQAEVEDVVLAPLEWCPHPENTIGMHLHGDSMLPVIPPDSILFVDTAETERDRLHQRLVVVSHRDLGFKVARFQRIGDVDLLVSANHKYAPLDVSNASKWKVFGEVLWWISRDAEEQARES